MVTPFKRILVLAINTAFWINCDMCSDAWPHSGRISIPMQSVHASTSQQHANVHGLVSKLNHVLSIFLFSKRQRKGDKMTVIREESLVKGGTLNSWSSLWPCTRQTIPALACTCLKHMLQSQPVKHVPWQGTLHGCMECMCDKEPFACHLECSHVVLLGHTRQWKSQQCAYTFKLWIDRL